MSPAPDHRSHCSAPRSDHRTVAGGGQRASVAPPGALLRPRAAGARPMTVAGVRLALVLRAKGGGNLLVQT